MQWIIPVKQRKVMDEYLSFFLACDDKRVWEVISNSLRERIYQISDDATMLRDEPLFGWLFDVFHPSVFAEMLEDESPLISRAIIDCLPELVREEIEFYLPPERLAIIRSIESNPGTRAIFFLGFLKGVTRKINIEKFMSFSQGPDIMSRLLVLNYKMMDSLVKRAGRFAMESKTQGDGNFNQKRDYVPHGLAVLSSLFLECEHDLGELFLLKFSPEYRSLISKLLQNEGVKEWQVQKSEEIIERILSSS